MKPHGAWLWLTALSASCTNLHLGSCDQQADLTGSWSFELAPVPLDSTVTDTVPRSDSIDVKLEQVQNSTFLSIGQRVWGTLTSQDTGFFDTLTIPRLVLNNGSKTGGEVGCTIKINVPIATDVLDDNSEQGPLRIALIGQIVARGRMTGDPRSQIILAEDARMRPRNFAWTGRQQ